MYKYVNPNIHNLNSINHHCMLSHVCLFVSLWTVARQAPLSIEFFQARILEWVAMPFSRGSSQPRDWACISCSGRQIPYYWATRESPGNVLTYHVNKPKEKNHAVMFVKAETGWQNSPVVHYKCLSKLEMQSFCNLIISFWKEKARHGKWCHLMVIV